MKDTYKFKGDTISLKGWSLRFDKERYREIWAGEDLRRLGWLCETPEERATLKAFKEFKNTITDRQFEVELKKQQG